MNDAELLVATLGGDPDAFAAFYRRHVLRVLGFLVRATGDPEVAADLAGEVFAVALASCSRYEPRNESALPWLLGIAQNKLRESRRRGRVENATRRRLQMASLPLGDDDVAEIAGFAELNGGDVVSALERLPVEEQRAVKARVVDERGYREIAAELKCSESVVRQRVSRGLAKVRVQLSDRNATEERS
jgi:RNA polymerase sigma-70 factor (ECF subfamily)